MSPFYSLELCIQRGISFLVPLPFTSFLFSAICKASSDNHFAFLFLGDGFDYHLLYNVKNFRPWFFRHSLLDLILWIYFSLPSLLLFGICIQMGLSFLISFAFHVSLFSAICKASSDNHFAFFHFFFLGMVLIPASCKVSWTSIHSSSVTLTIRSKPFHLFVTFTV